MAERPSLPRISVVTPSYNQGRYLERTIGSVLEQNYPNLEYIVIDGGSTDNSVPILEKYETRLTFWVSEPDRGQSHAINKGFARATGELLAWLNSDDYLMPRALHRFAEAALAHPEADAFVGIGRLVDEAGRIVDYREAFAEVTLESLYQWWGHYFFQPSCAFRRRAWDAAGRLDEGLHMAMDLDLWLKMVKAGCRFHGIPELLSTALSHRSAKSTAYPHLSFIDVAIVVIKHGGEHAVRGHLEDMAQRLSRLDRRLGHPLVRGLAAVLGPIAARLRGRVPASGPRPDHASKGRSSARPERR